MTVMSHRPYTFFGGKGGTGKTTCAAAYALSLARSGQRTLVVSTDPAHSLADALGHPLGHEISHVEDKLWGIEIDAEVEARKYISSIQEKMLHVVSGVIVDEIKKQIELAYTSPGAEEAAIFDKFIEMIRYQGEAFDSIVFDTAPTGHTLRLLSLPELLGDWIEHLIQKRAKAMDLMSMVARYDKSLRDKIKEDPVITTLKERKERFELARGILTDRERCAFFFVLNPEKLAILETGRAVAMLMKSGIPVGGVVVNRVIPEEAGVFMEKRRQAQFDYLEQIREKFGDLGVTELPMLDSDIQGMAELRRLVPYLRGVDGQRSYART